MFEKEPQFFGKEAQKGENKEAQLSMPAETPGLQELSEKETSPEIGPEEKLKMIRDFIKMQYKENEFEPIFSVTSEARKRLSKLDLPELVKVLGESELNLICANVAAANALKESMNTVVEDKQMQKYIKERGKEALPSPFRIALGGLEGSVRILSTILNASTILSAEQLNIKSLSIEEVRGIKASYLRAIKNNSDTLQQETEEWRGRLQSEERKKEKPAEITGFEKFDQPTIKGNELVKTIAADVLPRGVSSSTVERIKYVDRREAVDENYGVGEASIAADISLNEITFYKLPKEDAVTYLNRFRHRLAHEWGHSLDPREVMQKDLSFQDQFKMVEGWEHVRKNEKEGSSYVLKIKNQDRKYEEQLKSTESFAESAAIFLLNPASFKNLYPLRYDFCAKWFKQRFPEFHFEDEQANSAKRDRLNKLLEQLK